MTMAKVLTWKNDPLLYDEQPEPSSSWLTANDLLKKGIVVIDRDDQSFSNIYGILIRKNDFIKKKESDRILTRFPYYVLTKKEIEFIQTNKLVISQLVRDYFYMAITDKISSWRKRIDTYLLREAIPYPIIRCSWELEDYPLNTEPILTFESSKGKRYIIPIKITKKLAYLCGVINGDGHLHHFWLRVVDETKDHIELISKIFEELFFDAGEIFQLGKAWNVELRSSSAVRLFNFLTTQTIQGAKYVSLQEPLILKLLDDPYRRFYWRGVMDADGSFKQHISFSSASENFVSEFANYLLLSSIKAKKGKIGNYAYNLTIPALYRLNFIKQIGVDNPKKKKDMLELFANISYQFKGLNQENLITGKFFNLLKLANISVSGLSKYLITIRGKKSVTERSEELGIATNLYSEYEQGTRALELKTVQKILELNDEALLTFLSTQPNLSYQISTSKQVKLPIIITSKIIEILSILEPTKNYVKILLNDKGIKQAIEEIFGIKITDKMRIESRVLVNFCLTFGLYEKPTIADLALESILNL